MSDLEATPQDKLPGAIKAVQANVWVDNNRSYLTGPMRGTNKEAAQKASEELGFKVPVSMLTTLMQANGIETRRVSKAKAEKCAMQGEIERLNAKVMELTRTLAKVHISENVSEDMKDFIFAGLDDEIMQAIVNRG
jgi:hypothetical protein